MPTAMQRVKAKYPKAICRKPYGGQEVTITLGEPAHDNLRHVDTDGTFKFAYGTSTECWELVALKLKLSTGTVGSQ